jgi:hypothetical protein
MAKDYIEKRETGYYVIGSRVSLDSIVTVSSMAIRPRAFSNPIRPSPWNKSTAPLLSI